MNTDSEITAQARLLIRNIDRRKFNNLFVIKKVFLKTI
jgi:hypothetical protein